MKTGYETRGVHLPREASRLSGPGLSLTIALGFLLLVSTLARAQSPERLVDDARRDGLPVAPLLNKVKEGRAKKISEAIIGQVVARLVVYLREARADLAKQKQPAPQGLLASMAEARLGGVPVSIVRLVISSPPIVQAPRRVDALADLYLRGYQDREIADLVNATAPPDLPGLGRALDEIRRATAYTQAEVLDRFLKALRQDGGSVQRAIRRVAGKAEPHGQGGSPASKVKKEKPIKR